MLFAARNGIALPGRSDDIFPLIATGGFLPPVAGLLFIVGIVAAAYSSADSALTALTTSFTVDILNGEKMAEQRLTRTRRWVHVCISVVMGVVILVFRAINDESVISALFTVAGYTYGPLLGLFAFGLFTKRQTRDHTVPFLAILSPLLSYLLSRNSEALFLGYNFGYELLIINGAIMFAGLTLFSHRKQR